MQQAIVPCFDRGRALGAQGRGCPLKASGLLNPSERFLKRPAASSVYRTVFEIFRWPRYACKVRVSVPWLP